MKKSILRISLVTSILFVLFSDVFAIDWPSDNNVILHNFGWNDNGSPALSHSFESEGSIRAVDSGEIIFIQDDIRSVTNIPSPLGSWMAIEQGDGLIGIYSRFQNRENQTISYLVEQGAILGFSGLSGWSEQNGFSFSFYDGKEKRWVNPVMILPVRQDNRSPIIRQVLLRAQDGRIFNPATQRTLPQGQYAILVDASDTLIGANENLLAPHRISCLINGVESGVLHMETFSGQNGQLMAYRKSPSPAAVAYASFPSYELGEVILSRGQAVIEIIVSDVANNSRNAVYRITVQ